MPYLDLLMDAVGFAAPDGNVRAENQSMRSLLQRMEAASVPSNLNHLPCHEEDLRALRAYRDSGEAIHECLLRLQGVEREFLLRLRLQVSTDPVGHWLVLRDETEERQGQQRLARLDRLRQVGAMGEGVVHDLNNLMGAVMGLADHMSEETDDEELRGFLREMVRGTQQRARVLRALHHVLRLGKARRESMRLDVLLGDSLEMFRKTALHQERELDVQLAAEIPEVRVAPEQVMHLLLFLLNRSLEEAEGEIGLRVDRAPSPGRSARVCGRIQLSDRGDPASAQRLAGFLAQREPGLSQPGQYRLDEDEAGLFTTVLHLRLQGMELDFDPLPAGGRCWSIYLPATASRS